MAADGGKEQFDFCVRWRISGNGRSRWLIDCFHTRNNCIHESALAILFCQTKVRQACSTEGLQFAFFALSFPASHLSQPVVRAAPIDGNALHSRSNSRPKSQFGGTTPRA